MTSDRTLNLYRPLVTIILIELIVYTAMQAARAFLPSLDLNYLLLICPIASLEALYSKPLMQAQHLQSPDIPKFRFLEILALALLIRLISAANGGDYAANLLTVDLRFAVGLLIVIILWASALDTAHDFERLDEPPIPEAAMRGEYVSPLARLTTRFFTGGVLMFVALGVLTLGKLPVASLVAPIFAYFVIGLVTLPGLRFRMSRRVWVSLGIPIEDSMAMPWLRAGLVITALSAAFALLIPTGYLNGLLEFLASLVGLLIQIIVFLFTLLTWLISLPFHFLSGDMTLTLQKPPVMPQLPPVDNTAPPGDSPLLGLLVKIIPLLIVLYLVISYFRDHPELLAMLRRLRLFQFLATLWAALRQGLGGFVEGVRVRLPASLPIPFWRRNRTERFSIARLRTMTPRQRVLYFYMSILSRAEQQGIPRNPSQTPHEYSGTLKPSVPDAQQDLDTLSDAFVEARYSNHPVELAEARRAQANWRRVRQALKNVGKSSEGPNANTR